MNCQSSRDAHLLMKNPCLLTALSLDMCRGSVYPNAHSSFSIIVNTLCYMQIFLVREPLSLRHAHEMMKGTSQALPKTLRSPSAILRTIEIIQLTLYSLIITTSIIFFKYKPPISFRFNFINSNNFCLFNFGFNN